MNEYIQRAPYPTMSLPPMLQDFAARVVNATQSTYEMVVPVMLAGMSAAVQGLADVKTPYGDVIPVSLFACVIAKSGDRKSSVLKKVMQGFEDFERGTLPSEFIPGWGDQANLKSHQFFIEDATSKGVIDIFKEGAHSLFYALDEAAFLFKNIDMPGLCKRFDGSAINEVSRSRGVTMLHDRRVALCMLTQDVTFERFKSKKGDLLVESGLMPRMLMSQATSQPSNSVYIPNSKGAEPLEHHAFYQRVKVLMWEYAKSLGRPEILRQHIKFSPCVKPVWEQYVLQTELLVGPDGGWCDVRAFVRRSGELVCRVAAVLQYFADPQQDVQQWAAKSAMEIVAWHLCEAKRIFGEESLEVKFQKDVAYFYDYLLNRARRTGKWYIARSDVHRYGPTAVRNAEVLGMVIARLTFEGKLFENTLDRKKFLWIVDPSASANFLTFNFHRNNTNQYVGNIFLN